MNVKQQAFEKIVELVRYSACLGEDNSDLQKALELMLSVPHRAQDEKFTSSIEGYRGSIHKLGRLLAHDWFSVAFGDATKERYVFLFKGKILICKVRRISEDRSVFQLKDIIQLNRVAVKTHPEEEKVFELIDEDGGQSLTLTAHRDLIAERWLKEIKEFAKEYEDSEDTEAEDFQLASSSPPTEPTQPSKVSPEFIQELTQKLKAKDDKKQTTETDHLEKRSPPKLQEPEINHKAINEDTPQSQEESRASVGTAEEETRKEKSVQKAVESPEPKKTKKGQSIIVETKEEPKETKQKESETKEEPKETVIVETKEEPKETKKEESAVVETKEEPKATKEEEPVTVTETETSTKTEVEDTTKAAQSLEPTKTKTSAKQVPEKPIRKVPQSEEVRESVDNLDSVEQLDLKSTVAADYSVGGEVNVESADEMSRRYTSSSARAG